MRSARGLLVALLLVGSAAKPETTSENGTLLYNFSQRPRVNVADGDIRVTAEDATGAPPWGSSWLRVYVENLGSRPERVELEFAQLGSSSGAVRRVIEAQPGRTEQVTLIIPSGLNYGALEVNARGIKEGGRAHISFARGTALILAVGSDEAFKSFSGAEPDSSSYGVLVRTLPGDELPTELAAYTGLNAVVVLTPIESLSEGPRRTLEAWTATGGTLVLTKPSRALAQHLPLLQTGDEGLHPYGFGHVRICDGDAGGCVLPLATDLELATSPVRPMGEMTGPIAYDESGNVVSASEWFLLPQGVAPVGRFMLIILAFTLAIGPGSVWVAKKKGPPMLLLTIPATAAVACLLIVGWSVLVDGFAVHTSMRGYTLLDRRNDRAITLGLEAFYANLAPGRVALDGDTALLAPTFPSHAVQVASTDWTNGQMLEADFLPSRTYREWGTASVRPMRARVVVRNDGNAVVVENALGSDLRELWLRQEGQTYVLRNVRDGARTPLPGEGEGTGMRVDTRAAPHRFDPRVPQRMLSELKEGEFLARIDGPGPLPFADLRLTHHSSEHLIRGEVDR